MSLKVIDSNSVHFGMKFRNDKIGDGLIYSSCPENFHLSGKGKILDIEKIWFLDHNPFVVRNTSCNQHIDMQSFANATTFFNYGRSGLPCFLSVADRFNTKFGVQTRLRHPRLYKYEDLPKIPNRVVVHTTGDVNEPIALYEDCGAVMQDQVMDVIAENYKQYDIVQVGGKDDVPFERGCTDKRGLPIWDSVKEIAEAAIFIGVDSGPMNIALCYPRTQIRCYEPQFPAMVWENFYVPMDANFPHNQWKDWGIKIFNRYDVDLGVSYSYTKL